MVNEKSIDEIRHRAMEQIEKKEKNLKFGIAGIALYEGILLLLFALSVDWGNRVHLLIFISALLVYGTLGFGMVALAVYQNIGTLRIIKSIETVIPNK